MRSIRWKIMLMAFLVVYLPIYFLNKSAVEDFDLFTRMALEEEMISQARMIGEQYKTMVLVLGKDEIGGRRDAFAAMLLTYGRQLESRLQIVSANGIVLHDSDPSSMVGEDVSNRTEIQAAMAGRYDAESRLTADGTRYYYFIPIAIKQGEEVMGIAYVVRHTGQITKAILKMEEDQRWVMFMALAGALLVSAVLAQTMTRRLRRLTRVTQDYARGDAPLAVNIRGQDEIGDLGRAVEHMAAEIEERNEYNREFISTVTHELKMPVTAIKGAAELLEQGAVDKPEAREKFLSNIRYEADRLTRMVWELSELTKLDVEILRGQKEKLDYAQCVRDIVDRLVPTFDQEHASFRLDVPDEAIMVMIVPSRIEQVISNLLDNAFRYTSAGGEVTLRVSQQDDKTVLTQLRDTGKGIASADLGKVFHRFFTTEPKDVPKDYGSGLGLAIAKSIVGNHGGRIQVESIAGEGSTFSFTLPLGA